MQDPLRGSPPTAAHLHDLPGWLAGRWAIERVINDGAGRFAGDAVFAADGAGGAVWRETGRLALGAFDGPVSRNLRLRRADDETWQVCFEDGRSFHRLDLRARRWEAEHLCGPDRYRGWFAAPDDDQLIVRWRVTGPRRADVIASRYRRAV